MFITYSTDTPIYHYPFATVGTMAGCLAVTSSWLLLDDPDAYETLFLAWGDGYHPLQWLTSIFAHLGPAHLVGNLVFLWCFGLIVEGKIGWWRYLLVFLGTGLTQNILEQTIMLGAEEGASAGASSVIFGMMMMAMLWAPTCNLLGFFVFIRFVYFFESPIAFYCIAMVFWESTIVVFDSQANGFEMSTPLLHLMGAGVGLGFGLLLLKWNQVEAGGLDIFSVIRGVTPDHENEPSDDDASIQKELFAPKTAPHGKESARRAHEFGQIVQGGQAQLAWAAYQRFRKDDPHWRPESTDLLKLIGQFHNQKCWDESIPLMVEYLRQFQERSASVRLKLASILLSHSNRPTQANSVLSRIDPGQLNEHQTGLLHKLMAESESRHEEDALQIVEDW